MVAVPAVRGESFRTLRKAPITFGRFLIIGAALAAALHAAYRATPSRAAPAGWGSRRVQGALNPVPQRRGARAARPGEAECRRLKA